MDPEQAPEAIDDILISFRPRAQAGFRQSLKQRFIKAGQKETGWQTPSLPVPAVPGWAWAAAFSILLTLFMLLTPAGRALAQQILRLGVYTVTNAPSLAEQAISDPVPSAEVVRQRSINVEAAEASQVAGFHVYYPTFLPAGYKPADKQASRIVLDSEGEPQSIESIFEHAVSGQLLHLSQVQFPGENRLLEIPLGVGGARVEEVEVGSFEGLWLEGYEWGVRPGELGDLGTVRYNVLIWIIPAEDGGSSYFWLGSEAGLSKEEMLRIAQSMIEQ